MKNRIKFLFIGFWFGMIPYMFHLARSTRNNDSIGGEILTPLIPFLILGICKAIKEMKGGLKSD